MHHKPSKSCGKLTIKTIRKCLNKKNKNSLIPNLNKVDTTSNELTEKTEPVDADSMQINTRDKAIQLLAPSTRNNHLIAVQVPTQVSPQKRLKSLLAIWSFKVILAC